MRSDARKRALDELIESEIARENRALAEAWDRGWRSGRRDWWNETRTRNPYRPEKS